MNANFKEDYMKAALEMRAFLGERLLRLHATTPGHKKGGAPFYKDEPLVFAFGNASESGGLPDKFHDNLSRMAAVEHFAPIYLFADALLSRMNNGPHPDAGETLDMPRDFWAREQWEKSSDENEALMTERLAAQDPQTQSGTQAFYDDINFFIRRERGAPRNENQRAYLDWLLSYTAEKTQGRADKEFLPLPLNRP